MSRHEAPEIGAMIGRMLNALVRRAADGDWEALEALAEVERLAPAATNAALRVARDDYSLAQLADVLDVTRSAIAQRASRAVVGAEDCAHPTCVGMKRCRQRRGVGSLLVGCSDCGERGVQTGHMECQYPQDRP